ncbi:hypothetical protein ACIQ4I_15300 [Rummeliibacillus sp. NPDC094406]|uniref:hypothetical protein n=1 Tax=Rummeliibacillus sp. NPDC094406 TaxID=3364511 RepID=UPI00380AE366
MRPYFRPFPFGGGLWTIGGPFFGGFLGGLVGSSIRPNYPPYPPYQSFCCPPYYPPYYPPYKPYW